MSAVSNSRWVKCISTHGNLRGVAIQGTSLVRQVAGIHARKGESARALGEALMGALLIASNSKAGERVNLNIQGSGRISQALVDAYPEGKVRGYVVEREKWTQEKTVGPWGSGLLSVLRTKSEDRFQPYIGTVPLLTGHLAKDLTYYWAQSEQIPSAVGLAVHLDGEDVDAAGGFLIQALPGAKEEEIKSIEKNLHEIQMLASEIAREGSPVHLLSRIFQSTAFMILEERPLVMECTCSWERVTRALALIGAVELQSILDEDGSASVRCDFCSKDYRISAAELKKLIKKEAT